MLFVGSEEAFKIVRSQWAEEPRIVFAGEDRAQIRKAMADSEIYFSSSLKVSLNSELIKSAPKLRLVATATTGTDHIDTALLKSRKIRLLSLKEERSFLNNITSTAEHAWLLSLACSRKLVKAASSTKHGEWNRDHFRGSMMFGKTLGVVGVGRLGAWMCKYGNAFGMTVLGADPYQTEWPPDCKRVKLSELLRRSDVISLHVHLTSETTRLIGEKEFELMKPSAVLINTARGGLIDEYHLLKALEEGRLAAAGLDVLEKELTEDISQNSLIQYSKRQDNLIITPHIGGGTIDAQERTLIFMVRKIANEYGESKSAE